jgi:O-antigen/teichoic acid export membrane protein
VNLVRRLSGNGSVTPEMLGQWIGKGFSAVMDQGLFALSNFLLNVMLARWLAPRDYGAFTVAFTAFLFFGTFHSALLIEPMLVFGSVKYAGRYSEYLAVLLSGHWALVTAGSLMLLVAGLAVGMSGPSALPLALEGFALAGPFILLMWLMRRACYVRLEPHLAALGGVLYLLLIVAGLYTLNQHGWLSMASALALMGFAGLATSAWLTARLRIGFPSLPTNGLLRETWRAHWEYGRWAAAALVLTWVPGDIYYILLPMWKGLDASATLRALINLTMPIRNTNIALALVILPSLVRTQGTAEFGRLTRLATLALVGLSVAYWVPVLLFHRSLLAWLYGGRYETHPEVLALLGVFLVLSSGVDILGAALRAVERPDQVFKANVLATIVALTVGLWCMVQWGVLGAAAALALSSVVKIAAMWRYYRLGHAADAGRRDREVVSAPTVV